jgi:hypothetical protein
MLPLNERREAIIQKALRDVDNMIQVETFKESLPECLKDASVFKSELYGIKYWLSIDTSLVGLSGIAHELDKLETVEVSKFKDGSCSFMTDNYIDQVMSEEQAMRGDRTYILPVTIKVNAAHFCKTYEFECYKIINGVPCRVSVKTNSRLKGLTVDRTYRSGKSEKLINIELKHGDTFELYHETECIGHREQIKWWSSDLETSSWSVYWTRNNETSQGFSIHSLVHMLHVGGYNEPK